MTVRLADASHRGLLLDLVVFALNLFAFTLVQRDFVDVVQRAAADEPAAQLFLFGCAVALLVFAPAGATLKRWHYHQRLGKDAPDILDGALGCLFNPIFYFCLTAVLFAAANAFVLQGFSGKREPGGAAFAISMVLGIALMLTHTWLVYRFFSPPKHPPASPFLRSRASEFFGDACLYANALLFQLFWNLLSFTDLGPPRGIAEFAGRLFVLIFLALLIYLPPRMFYLAEDAGKRHTWIMILLANAPVIARVLT